MTEVSRNVGKTKMDLFEYKSVKRISSLPVVETSYQYFSSMYNRVKNVNGLVRWGLGSVEGGLQMAAEQALPALPLGLVDGLVCRGLDTVESRLPVITYPPELLISLGRDFLAARLQPVLRRADSVKQLGLHEASRVGEIAATKLDSALVIADKYVDKYLPDASDTTDGNKETVGESKTSQAMNHINSLSRKLQRRITKRTLMEAEALKKGGADTFEKLVYLAELLLRDPKEFGDQIAQVWRKLSEDEPENQVPPANLEQLMGLLVRESARRMVHASNFIVATLPVRTAHYASLTLELVQFYSDYFLKLVHLERVKNVTVNISAQRLKQLRFLALQLLEVLNSRLKSAPKKDKIPLQPLALSPPPIADSNANSPPPQSAPPVQVWPTETSPKPQNTNKQSTTPKQDSPVISNGTPTSENFKSSESNVSNSS